jgi:hypothetical protein
MDITVTTFEQHKRFIPDPAVIPEGHIAHPHRMSVDEIEDTLSEIHGKLVQFPTEYLREENLQGGQVNRAVTPMHLFT